MCDLRVSESGTEKTGKADKVEKRLRRVRRG